MDDVADVLLDDDDDDGNLTVKESYVLCVHYKNKLTHGKFQYLFPIDKHYYLNQLCKIIRILLFPLFGIHPQPTMLSLLSFLSKKKQVLVVYV